MTSYFKHIGLVCITAYIFYYAVRYYRFVHDESNSSTSNVIKPSAVQHPDAEVEWEMDNLAAENELIETIINERYLVGDVMAVGRTATIRSGMDMDQDNNTSVVIKFAKPGTAAKRLENEYRHYLLLDAEDPKTKKFGIPNVMFFGEHGGYKVLVMQMLGPTLHQMTEMTKARKLSGKSILKIAAQLMDTFGYIHSKSIVFREITSSNFAIGDSKDTVNKIYVLDLASSAKVSNKFIPKDDLIKLGLILLELNGVTIESIDDNHTETNAIIESLLENWNENYINKLCGKADNSEVFLNYFGVLAAINSTEYPNYEKLKEIFNEGLSFEEFKEENLGIFDAFA